MKKISAIIASLTLIGLMATMPVSAAGITAGVMSCERGSDDNTINMTVNGISATNGINQIDCDVWSAYNSQDDLKNYVLSNNGTGKYTGSFTIANHYYDDGIYYVDIYATDGSGGRECIGTTYALIECQVKNWIEYQASGGQINGTNYAVALSTSSKMTPNVEANNTETLLKSGYGFSIDVSSSTTLSNDHPASNTATPIQTMNVVFPEFNYKNGVTVGGVLSTYNRLGKVGSTASTNNVATSVVNLKENPFSTNKSAVHFTPLWYPDSTGYQISVDSFDSWTPAGMLSATSHPGTNIDGHVYEDWHIAPILND